MHALVVVSGVKRPFAPIDLSIVRALKQLGVTVTPLSPGRELNDRLLSVAAHEKPDFVLVHMGWRLTKGNLTRLQQVNIPKMVWFTDDPYYMDWSKTVGKHFDLVFTNESRSVSVYRENRCPRVFHLPLGVDTTVFFPRPSVPRHFQSDILVLGTAFQNRVAFLKQLLPRLPQARVRLVGPGWEKLKHIKKRHVTVHPKWVSPKAANGYYNGASIVLNLERSPWDEYLQLNRGNVRADTPNNRTFEVAACSAFQLSEERADYPSLYPNHAKGVTFRTPGECLKRIRYYLPREKERRQIANDMYECTIETHQYQHRLQQLIDTFNENLSLIG